MLELVTAACIKANDDDAAVRWGQASFSVAIRSLRDGDDSEALSRSGIVIPNGATWWQSSQRLP